MVAEYHRAATHAANARHEAMMEKAKIIASILEACLKIVMLLMVLDVSDDWLNLLHTYRNREVVESVLHTCIISCRVQTISGYNIYVIG